MPYIFTSNLILYLRLQFVDLNFGIHITCDGYSRAKNIKSVLHLQFNVWDTVSCVQYNLDLSIYKKS